MLKTKHAYIVAVLVIGVACAVVFYMNASHDKVISYSTDAQFVYDEGPQKATVDGREKSEGVADRLRNAVEKRILEGEVIEEDVSVEESDVATADEVNEGVLIGDGRISAGPQQGHIYACESNFNDEDMTVLVPWIEGDVWFPDQKLSVQGSVAWQGDTSIERVEGARILRAEGLPNHSTGIFPISPNDPAYQYAGNSGSISEQDIVLQLPENPLPAAGVSCISLGPVGVALNGITIFSGLDAMGRDVVAHGVFDACHGHPDENGMYHYHNESECLLNAYYEGADSTIIGYALDGFGIYASNEYGETLTNDDLDACHGHVHMIPWDGEYKNMYHYHMTDEYPYTVGCFMGIPNNIIIESGSEDAGPPMPVEPDGGIGDGAGLLPLQDDSSSPPSEAI